MISSVPVSARRPTSRDRSVNGVVEITGFDLELTVGLLEPVGQELTDVAPFAQQGELRFGSVPRQQDDSP